MSYDLFEETPVLQDDRLEELKASLAQMWENPAPRRIPPPPPPPRRIAPPPPPPPRAEVKKTRFGRARGRHRVG